MTLEDFQWLAMNASPYVWRAVSFTTPADPYESETIWVAIQAADEADQPYPRADLLSDIQRNLQSKALLTIQHRIRVIGPDYVSIHVALRLIFAPEANGARVRRRVERQLRVFLNPLTGGMTGEGWNFGQTLHTWQVHHDVAHLDGVTHVVAVHFVDAAGALCSRVQLCNAELPWPGDIDIHRVELM